MMNEPIKLTKQLITFSLDSELIKNFKLFANNSNLKRTLTSSYVIFFLNPNALIFIYEKSLYD